MVVFCHLTCSAEQERRRKPMSLEIEAHENSITLRASVGSTRWFFLAIGLGAPFLMWWQGHLRLDGSGGLGSYFGALFFAGIGLFVALQPTVETTFDLAAKVIRVRRRIAIVSRQTLVPFSAVEGIGLREASGENGATYRPELRTWDGTIHKLSAEGSAYFHADGLLEQVRQATGLRRLDRPER
jgi:hypothetical protein